MNEDPDLRMAKFYWTYCVVQGALGFVTLEIAGYVCQRPLMSAMGAGFCGLLVYSIPHWIRAMKHG